MPRIFLAFADAANAIKCRALLHSPTSPHLGLFSFYFALKHLLIASLSSPHDPATTCDSFGRKLSPIADPTILLPRSRDTMDALLSRLDSIVLNPELAPLLSLLKGIRNGVVYGSKVRFPHALVMIFLFRSGTFREKAKLVLSATRQHARNLATFALIYKSSMIVLRNVNPAGVGKEGRYDSFFAGLLGGYAVFGRHFNGVSQQIVIYIFARVMLALAKIAVAPNMHPLSSLITPEARTKLYDNAWPAFASLSWALVMYIFRWYPETLASSLRSSMVYIYADSDHWDSFRNLLIHNK